MYILTQITVAISVLHPGGDMAGNIQPFKEKAINQRNLSKCNYITNCSSLLLYAWVCLLTHTWWQNWFLEWKRVEDGGGEERQRQTDGRNRYVQTGTDRRAVRWAYDGQNVDLLENSLINCVQFWRVILYLCIVCYLWNSSSELLSHKTMIGFAIYVGKLPTRCLAHLISWFV